MSYQKYNFEALQEQFAIEYERTHHRFPTRNETYHTKQELIRSIVALKRLQRKQKGK